MLFYTRIDCGSVLLSHTQHSLFK